MGKKKAKAVKDKKIAAFLGGVKGGGVDFRRKIVG